MTPTACNAILERAGALEVACDLEAGLGLHPAQAAERLIELFEDPAFENASPRALWNVLWLAAELTTRVDLYRARALLHAVEQLFTGPFGARLIDGDPRAQAAEMAFDFFFNRLDQPLLVLDPEIAVRALERVLTIDNRHCRRAAIHGLGHLRRAMSPTLDARIDTLFASIADPSLAAYAAWARSDALE